MATSEGESVFWHMYDKAVLMLRAEAQAASIIDNEKCRHAFVLLDMLRVFRLVPPAEAADVVATAAPSYRFDA